MTTTNVEAINTPSFEAENLAAFIDQRIQDHLDERLPDHLRQTDQDKTPSLGIIATKGTMDMGYPPFILASTAAALGWEVSIFFTFYGLELLKKHPELKVSPLGNPAMPMKMPFGPQWLQKKNWNIPNLAMAAIPGFENMATSLMKKTLSNKGVASIQDLRDMCLESDVKLYACQMTVDLFGYQQDEFIEDVEGWIGATSFLTMAENHTVSLFV